MILFLDAKTPIEDIFIDYIEIILATGEQVGLNWDFSGIDRFDYGFSAKYSGVYFGEENANGRIKELTEIKVVEIGYYTEKCVNSVIFEIQNMEFIDQGHSCQPSITYLTDYNLCFTG